MGTIPGWITAGSTVTLLIAFMRMGILGRKVDVEALATKNLDAENIRDHYAKEVAALREALIRQSTKFREDLAAMETRYRELLDHSDHQHRECLEDRDKLRGEVGVLRNEIDGLVRVIAQASIDRVIMLGDAVPEHIKEAAERAQAFIAKERQK
ncbi:MAG: hypothetical protein V4696_00775 [Pseudomonadota bacterium]